MAIPKKKKEKIRKFLEDGKTWEYIRNKEGVSNDAINKIRQKSLSSTASTTTQADKTPRVIQAHTNQKQQPPTTKNTPDSHVQYLEHKINNVDQGIRTNNQQLQNVVELLNQLKQSQQPQETKEPQPEKPDDQPNLHEVAHQETITKSLPSPITQVQLPKKNPDQTDASPQEIKMNPSPSLDPDIPQLPKTNLIQIVSPPENQEDEDQAISSYYNALIFREAAKATSFLIKLGIDYSNYTKTEFFPLADYLKYGKKTKNEKKIKKPIIGDKPKPSPPPCFLDPQKEKMYRERIANSERRIEDSLRKTNEWLKNQNKYLDNPGTHIIAIGFGKGLGIVISPVLKKKYIQQT